MQLPYLSTPSSANYSDALSRLGFERNVMQNVRAILRKKVSTSHHLIPSNIRTHFRIASRQLLYSQRSTGRPICRGNTCVCVFRLLLDNKILLHAFQTGQLCSPSNYVRQSVNHTNLLPEITL